MRTIPETSECKFATLADAARAAAEAARLAAVAFENLAAQAARFEAVLVVMDDAALRAGIVKAVDPARDEAREAVRNVRAAQAAFGDAVDLFSPPNRRRKGEGGEGEADKATA